MTKLSENFSLQEFAVSGSKPGLVQPVPGYLKPNVERLVRGSLQPLRTVWGVPLKITSGYRPPKLNNAIGGSPTSQHLTATAADFTTEMLFEMFFALMAGKFNDIGQVILYPSRQFIHLSLPSRKFNKPTFQINEPTKRITYEPVETVSAAKKLIVRSLA